MTTWNRPFIAVRPRYDGSLRRQLVVNLGRYTGASICVMADSDGTRWLCGVVWYRRSVNRLGYLYPSLRIGRAS